MSALTKNLYPKFNQYSQITSNVRDIINHTLQNPVKIPNYLGYDNPIVEIEKQISPYQNSRHIAEYQYTDKKSLDRYFNTYKSNRKLWEESTFNQKKHVFLTSADLLKNKYYDKMLAYTILGQNKTIYEAELDAICELVDFLRFNIYYAEQIINKQPISIGDHKNISEYNNLNGFVASITPFNFTAIGGNLATAPLFFGNSVLWKPSDNAILSNHLFYEIMLEAGLPKGVLNFCPMEPSEFLNNIYGHPELAAVLFTGSSKVLDNIYEKTGENIKNLNNYPRIIGESGGKNFHFVDNSYLDKVNYGNNLDFVVEKTLESAFNFSGQKCSACSIIYVPESLLDETINLFISNIDFYTNNMTNYGVINRDSYERLVNIIDDLKMDDDIEFVIENGYTDTASYYIKPQIILSRNSDHYVFKEEFFGPVLAIRPYSDEELDETINECIFSNKYALTGSIFSHDDKFITAFSKKMRHKTGNFYINDKSTGSVVGQQPFGGSGKSGTNDKAGDINLLYRLINQRNIKINYDF